MCKIIEPMCEKWALNSNLMAKVGVSPICIEYRIAQNELKFLTRSIGLLEHLYTAKQNYYGNSSTQLQFIFATPPNNFTI